jgi:ribosomal protein S18 acetylase RimI-like enzyme
VSESGNSEVWTAVFRTPDDRLAVAVTLADWARRDMPRLIAEARAAAADVVWVEGFFLDSGLGFERRGGYARLQADWPTDTVELASPPRSLVRALQSACYRGVWGHREPTEPDADATFVGLHEHSRWVGICEFDAEAGLIGCPGVIPEFRAPDRYARLVRGAVARIENRPLILETRGDSDEVIAAYEQLGFRLVEYVPGWELELRIDKVPEGPH